MINFVIYYCSYILMLPNYLVSLCLLLIDLFSYLFSHSQYTTCIDLYHQKQEKLCALHLQIFIVD